MSHDFHPAIDAAATTSEPIRKAREALRTEIIHVENMLADSGCHIPVQVSISGPGDLKLIWAPRVDNQNWRLYASDQLLVDAQIHTMAACIPHLPVLINLARQQRDAAIEAINALTAEIKTLTVWTKS